MSISSSSIGKEREPLDNAVDNIHKINEIVSQVGFVERTCHQGELSLGSPCNIPGVGNNWVKNCEKLFEQGISEDALKYALNVIKLNAVSFRTHKCYKMQDHRHYSMQGMTKEKFQTEMNRGIKNKCQFIINDTRDRYDKKYDCRRRMYYIDLCQGGEPKVVKSYFNMGTGTCRKGRGFVDKPGLHTTLLRAFLTNTQYFDFAKNNGPYSQLKRDVKKLMGKKEATSLQLFGLQNTNSRASLDNKYIHLSPYKSSWGCPSIAKENYYMIHELANNGPSLVLNYGEEMEDINECTQ